MGLHTESIFLRQPGESSQASPAGVEGLIHQADEGAGEWGYLASYLALSDCWERVSSMIFISCYI